VEKRPEISAEYFDQWYANMGDNSPHDEIVQRHLGLPRHLLSTSLLTWDGIADVVDALRLAPDETLLDLACGRGGYGLEIASRTGARLIGVDFSAEAVRLATENARRWDTIAEFRVGDLTATGLPSGSVNAVLCVDAVQFADEPAAAYAEMRRVLVPGGRVVLTCWEAHDRADERVPSRLRAVDTGRGLRDAGFAEVATEPRPGWRAAELAMWREAAALDPGDDPALRSFHDEGVRVLEDFELFERVMASAQAP
jgi:SAM-dependent methyltransferase